jgi:hypothetical protein
MIDSADEEEEEPQGEVVGVGAIATTSTPSISFSLFKIFFQKFDIFQNVNIC